VPLHQRDFILRLIEQAGVAVARLEARLLGKSRNAGALEREAARMEAAEESGR
jgi:hypothetical protein